MRLLEIALKCAVPCIRLLSVFCRPQGTEPAPAGGRVPCLRRKAQRRSRQAQDSIPTNNLEAQCARCCVYGAAYRRLWPRPDQDAAALF